MSKLLIVDDEEDVREFAANFFRKRKVEVTTAPSGEAAVETVRNFCPDLVLLDIRMSGISGIQALEQIRMFNPTVKVIMVTGTKPEDNDALAKCQSMGVLEYIHKPLRLDELERVVMAALK